MEKLREMQASGEMIGSNNNVEAAMANLTEFGSLLEAFNGCRAVFHTAAFIDPSGVSGYSVSRSLSLSIPLFSFPLFFILIFPADVVYSPIK